MPAVTTSSTACAWSQYLPNCELQDYQRAVSHSRCPTAAQPIPLAVPLQRATAGPLADSVRDCRNSRDSTMQRMTQTRCRWMRPPTTEREACPSDVRVPDPRPPILALGDGLAGPASPGARSACETELRVYTILMRCVLLSSSCSSTCSVPSYSAPPMHAMTMPCLSPL